MNAQAHHRGWFYTPSSCQITPFSSFHFGIRYFTQQYTLLIAAITILNNKTPTELIFHSKPNYLFLKKFDCDYFPFLRPYNSTKFDYKSNRCIFLGYSLQHKGNKYFDPLCNKVYITKHVKFNENSFPYAEIISSQNFASAPQFPPSSVPYIPLLVSNFSSSSVASQTSSSSNTPPHIKLLPLLHLH